MGRLLVIALAAIIAGLVVFALGIGRTTFPDTNQPVGDNGQRAVGYFDVEVKPTFYVQDNNLIAADLGRIGFLSIKEHLNQPTGPVATFFPPFATAAFSCSAYMNMFVSGPGVSEKVKSDVYGFPVTGGQITIFFGHTYAFEKSTSSDTGRYAVTLEVYMKGCGSYENWTFGDTFTYTLAFDGQNEP